MLAKSINTFNYSSYKIWLVATSFVLLQFFLQLSSGVVIGSIMYTMNLSALTAGMLGSSFYIIYTILQIPVGILCDKQNPKVILTTSASICGIGCLIFASGHTLSVLFIGRFLIGVGSAFAFVVLVHLIRSHYPLKNFSILIGISETLGFLATVIGIIGMGRFILSLGWRGFINLTALCAIFIALLCWLYIPSVKDPISTTNNYLESLKKIISNKLLWINGLYIGLCFATITVFGALWAAPFLEAKLHCSMRYASLVNAFLFLGAAIGCPLFGVLTKFFIKIKPLIINSCIFSAIIFFLIIYLPTTNLFLVSFLMFILGITCCSYILAYAISNELSPADSLSTGTGFTNTLALVTAPILQPVIGYILEKVSSDRIYTLEEYQVALFLLPCSLIIAAILVTFLPEKS